MSIMDIRYFNFPISFLSGFFKNEKDVFEKILNYAVYYQTLDYENGNDKKKAIDSLKYLRVTNPNPLNVFKIGRELYDSTPSGFPMVGINVDTYWDFKRSHKSEFEKVCLLASLGIKSILGRKTYCKITMKYLLARMNGESKSNEHNELPEPLQKYALRYHYTKLKLELQHNWNLKEYSFHTRGFYVSFKLEQEELIYKVEESRQTRRNKELMDMKKQVRLDVLNQLNK